MAVRLRRMEWPSDCPATDGTDASERPGRLTVCQLSYSRTEPLSDSPARLVGLERRRLA